VWHFNFGHVNHLLSNIKDSTEQHITVFEDQESWPNRPFYLFVYLVFGTCPILINSRFFKIT
jgi:hypothetical protein